MTKQRSLITTRNNQLQHNSFILQGTENEFDDMNHKNADLLKKMEKLEQQLQTQESEHKNATDVLVHQNDIYLDKFEKQKAKILELERELFTTRNRSNDLENQLTVISKNNQKNEQWNESMNGLNEQQSEKISNLQLEVQKYKGIKDKLQS